jgi:hypothetical protein
MLVSFGVGIIIGYVVGRMWEGIKVGLGAIGVGKGL